jgi:hypothetical protein
VGLVFHILIYYCLGLKFYEHVLQGISNKTLMPNSCHVAVCCILGEKFLGARLARDFGAPVSSGCHVAICCILGEKFLGARLARDFGAPVSSGCHVAICCILCEKRPGAGLASELWSFYVMLIQTITPHAERRSSSMLF